MADIMLTLDGNEVVSDISIFDGDLVIDDGLKTSVIISLFCDAKAENTDILPSGETSRRGYWADSEGNRIGSKLWLLHREKLLPTVAVRARQYAEESLAWMLEDGIAASIIAETEIQKPDMLKLGITISRGSNKDYDYLWQGLVKQANNLDYPLITENSTELKTNFLIDFVNGRYELIG